MAKPGLDSIGVKASYQYSAAPDQQSLTAWFDTSEHPTAAVDRVSTAAAIVAADDPAALREKAMQEVLLSKRNAFRSQLLQDGPEATREAPKPFVGAASTAQGLLTNLELTNDKKPSEVVAAQIRESLVTKPTPQTIAATRDLGFASIRLLEGPNSASSQFMANQRPDLIQAFQSQECSLRMGSSPDGTVFEVLTSPDGFSRMLTAKGSTTVEIIADRNGNELFKHSSRNSSNYTKPVISA